MNKLTVPQEILDPFFFSEEEITLSLGECDMFNPSDPFVHEIAYYLGIASVKPWEATETSIPELMKAWQVLQMEIKGLFEQRNNRGSLLPMKRGIGYLIEFIFWTNGLPAQKIIGFDFARLQLKPVNFTERIQFLLQRPNIYPSFVQLIELFEEQQKQYSKYLAIMKVKNKNSQ